MPEPCAIGWTLDLWDGDGRGIRLSADAETASGGDPDWIEFGLLMTREEAFQNNLIEHCTHGDSSAHVDVTKLDPECEVYLFGGLVKRAQLVRYLRSALNILISQDLRAKAALVEDKEQPT